MGPQRALLRPNRLLSLRFARSIDRFALKPTPRNLHSWKLRSVAPRFFQAFFATVPVRSVDVSDLSDLLLLDTSFQFAPVCTFWVLLSSLHDAAPLPKIKASKHQESWCIKGLNLY